MWKSAPIVHPGERPEIASYGLSLIRHAIDQIAQDPRITVKGSEMHRRVAQRTNNVQVLATAVVQRLTSTSARRLSGHRRVGTHGTVVIACDGQTRVLSIDRYSHAASKYESELLNR